MKYMRMTILAILLAVVTPANAASKEDLKEMTALILNMNGLLCAEVVDIRPLKVRKGTYEVECIEYRGGKGRKTYIMDAAKGTAWVP